MKQIKITIRLSDSADADYIKTWLLGIIKEERRQDPAILGAS